MNKVEYMKELVEKLAGFEEELVQEIVIDYEERFADGAENGKTEEEIIAELGSVEDLAQELKEIQEEMTREHIKSSVKQETGSQKAEETEKKAFQEQAEDFFTETKIEENQEQTQENTKFDWEKFGKNISGAFNQTMLQMGEELNKVGAELNKAMEQVGQAMEHFDFDMFKFDIITNEDGEKEIKFGTKKEDIKKDYDWEEVDEEEENTEYKSKANRCSGEAQKSCKRVVIDATVADVILVGTEEENIKVEYTNDSWKDAMLYSFYSYENGDTFYTGVKKNKEKKCGFFQMNHNPDITLKVRVPRNMMQVEINTSSGDIEGENVQSTQLKISAMSGDICCKQFDTEKGELYTMSGDIEVEKIIGKRLEFVTKSGDIDGKKVGADTVYVNSISGDANITELEAENMEVKTTSGDISICQTNASKAEASSVSGDVDVKEAKGMSLQIASISGDVTVDGTFKDYKANSQSGDIVLKSDCEANIFAKSTSGDNTIIIPEGKEGYTIITNTKSGVCKISRKGEVLYHSESSSGFKQEKTYTFGMGEYQVQGQSISGNIIVKIG